MAQTGLAVTPNAGMTPLATESGDTFCDKCRAVVSILCHQGPYSDLRHHETLREFNQAVDQGCPLCYRLLASIEAERGGYQGDLFLALSDETKLDEQLPITVDFRRVSDEGWGARLVFVLGRYSIHGSTSGHDIRFFKLREIDSSHLLSERSMGETTESVDVGRWLKKCLTSHTACSKGSDYLPPRLLDCGGQRLRLVLPSREVSSDLRYATLSHCWGKTPSPCILTTSNIDTMTEGIAQSDLPRTFRDAISTTRKLGVRYLWIDSLCIIQRGLLHTADWEHHVREMANIYSNGIVNISASHGSDSTAGCFAPKTSLSRPCAFRASTGELFSLEYRLPLWLQKSHIFSRAWVFQERLLSPRVVHYATHDAFWECKSLRASGAYPEETALLQGQDFSFHMFETTIPLFDWKVFTKKDHYLGQPGAVWKQLLSRYTATNLTSEGDRLPALGGIAQRFNGDYPGGRYLAGIFEDDLPGALMWTPRGPYARGQGYVAPSWSWASVTPTRLDSHTRAMNGKLALTINAAEVDLVDPSNPYGQVSGGWMDLRGPMLHIPPDPDFDTPEKIIGIAADPEAPRDLSYYRLVHFNWDCGPPPRIPSGGWSLLAISTRVYHPLGETAKGGLVLREATPDEAKGLGSGSSRGLRCFVRVGTFSTSAASSKSDRHRVIRHVWDEETIMLV